MPPRKKISKADEPGPMVQVGLRLPVSVVDAIDVYAQAIKVQVPGLEVSRSDAARALIMLGLEASKKRKS